MIRHLTPVVKVIEHTPGDPDDMTVCIARDGEGWHTHTVDMGRLDLGTGPTHMTRDGHPMRVWYEYDKGYLVAVDTS